jgi:hypothetical protein
MAEVAKRHASFLTGLAGKLPRLAVRRVELKHAGESVFDLTVVVENVGYLPTSLAQGEQTREVHPTRATLELDAEHILTGNRRIALDPLPGSGGIEEARWIFFAPDRTEVTVAIQSMLGGSLRRTVPLNEAR